jgi:hypothetical protein
VFADLKKQADKEVKALKLKKHSTKLIDDMVMAKNKKYLK